MTGKDIHHFLIEQADGLPELAGAIATLGPREFPMRGEADFPLHLCRSIAGQQISVGAARAIWSRVVASAGETPLLEHFCPERHDTLRACGLSGAKTRTIITIAETHRAEGLDADALRALPVDTRKARMTEIWGVGPWTADMMNMFYFAEPDIWPDGDVAARKTLERLTSKRRSTVRTAARFKPWRSWLALYMWAHVDARPGT
ncbi:DNA-3-methyladenine glycosylase family protein [Maricaulis sp. CAU 1757]